MPRARNQRPEVHLWTGKSGQKFWKIEYRVYLPDGKTSHKAHTWPTKQYSKTAAQKAADELVQRETSGPAPASGSMSVADYWTEIYFPVASHRLAPNSRTMYASHWKNHIKPAIGGMELQQVRKHTLSALLDTMADAQLGHKTVSLARSILSVMFEDALQNGYIQQNPAHKVTMPRCKAETETRPLTEEEARRVLESTEGMAHILFRVLFATGARIGEVLALKKADLTTEGLMIDESAYRGAGAQTKSKKERLVAIPDQLRRELIEWGEQQIGDLIFPNRSGRMFASHGKTLDILLRKAREDSKVPHLTYRACRTTFATLYDGDARDLQGMLGHAKLDTSMKFYRKPIFSRQQAAVDAMEARLTGKVVSMPGKKRA
jgi:integrase